MKLIYLVLMLTLSIVPAKSTMDFEKTILLLEQKYQNIEMQLQKNSQLLETLQIELQDLREDAVPIGFLYTEYPGEVAPQTLWPNQNWLDVSENFAGNFFRVVGGNSSEFGVVQSASSGSVLEAKNYYESCWLGGCEQYSDTISLSTEDAATTSAHRTQQLFTGSNEGVAVKVDFLVSNQETRPVNMAVRVWRRVA